MALGDSITESSSPHYSYRLWLQKSLNKHGYGPMDFVGSMRGQLGNERGTYKFDQDHEGHAGWTADQVLDKVSMIVQEEPPDVVLMHVGTNDLRLHESPESTIVEIRQIVEALRQTSEHVTVLLSTLIPNHYDSQPRQELNQQIIKLAQTQDRRGSRVIAVDSAGGFDYFTDTHDGLHPNTAGERKISRKFFAALKHLLPRNVQASVSRGTSRATVRSIEPVEFDSLTPLAASQIR